MNSVDEAWDKFLSGGEDEISPQQSVSNVVEDIPTCSDIYISTKTIIAYLNQPVDLKNVFWKLDIIPYTEPRVGIVKKQMKFNSTTPEEIEHIEKEQHNYEYSCPVIIHHIENPTGFIKYKDSRKVSVGISRKDLITCRANKKGAFYNCFVVIIRIHIKGAFREFHVKVFNTGKLELPGIQCQEQIDEVIKILLSAMVPHCKTLEYVKGSEETVLINSNFNCGFFIKRQALYEKLRQEYNISSLYDPCTYPGIQSKIFFNVEGDIYPSPKSTSEARGISFMIFRTGSVLIVGKCEEAVLRKIYQFIKLLLHDQYYDIIDRNCTQTKKENKPKQFKRSILCSRKQPLQKAM
jgi:hypothetical protein